MKREQRLSEYIGAGGVHRMVMVHREGHIHRWWPQCSCGVWVGLPVKLKEKARHQHRKHVRAVSRKRRKSMRVIPLQRPLTPTSKLPEELQ